MNFMRTEDSCGNRSSGGGANVGEKMLLIQDSQSPAIRRIEDREESTLRLAGFYVPREPRRDFDNENAMPAQNARFDVNVSGIPRVCREGDNETVLRQAETRFLERRGDWLDEIREPNMGT
jgi:hypothetical protein